MTKNRFGGLRRKLAVITSVVLALQGLVLGVLVSPSNVQAASSDVVINEFLADGPGGNPEPEWIEIYNRGTGSVVIDGWEIVDSSDNKFAEITTDTIGSGKFRVYDNTSILNNGGDTIYLKDNLGSIIDSKSYTSGDITEGVSLARKPDGTGVFIEDATPTKETANNTAPFTPYLSSPADTSYSTSSTINFVWTPDPIDVDVDGDEITYNLQVADNPTFTSPLHNVPDIDTITHSIGSFVDDTYYWRVRTFDGYEYSDWTSSWSFTVDTTNPISEASVEDYQTINIFNINYTASDPGLTVDYVELYFKGPGSAVYEKYAPTSNSTGQWTTSPIIFTAGSDGTYYFYTKAYDKAGNEELITLPPSDDDSTVVDTTAPGTPSNVKTIVGDGKVTLNWDPSTTFTISDIAGYKIVWGPWTNPQGYVVDVGNVTSHTITGLLNNTAYYFLIVAYDKAGNSSWSKLISATPVAPIIAPAVALATPAFAAPSEVTLPPEGETPSDEEIKGDEASIGEATEDTKEEEEEQEEKGTSTWGIIILIALIAIGGYLYFAQSEGGYKPPKLPKLPKLPWKK